MAFQAIPNVAQVTLQFDRGADWRPVNVHHFRKALPWTGPALESLGDDIEAWWTASLKPRTSPSLTLESILVRDIGAEFGLEDFRTVNEAGTDASSAILPVISALVQWTCDAGAPPRRGRTYFPSLVEEDISGSSILATPLGEIEAVYEALRAVDGGVTAALVIPTRSGAFAPPADGSSNTIASVSVRPQVAIIQRRRLLGG